MNQKYKSGIYFGIYTMVLCVILPLIIHPAPLNKYSIVGIFIFAPIAGAIMGFMFGWMWNLFRPYKAKDL